MALRFAYDYYPFGMLMPGRYVSDTSQHCVTVTRPTWVWKWVISNCHDVYGLVWYNYLKVGRGTVRCSGCSAGHPERQIIRILIRKTMVMYQIPLFGMFRRASRTTDKTGF